MALAFLVLTALVAIGDWAAVGYRYFRLEYLLKPLTLALLVVAAAGAALGPGHWWVVAALACCLLGDVALLGERDSAPGRGFLAGAGAFGLGHACYLVAFSRQVCTRSTPWPASWSSPAPPVSSWAPCSAVPAPGPAGRWPPHSAATRRYSVR